MHDMIHFTRTILIIPRTKRTTDFTRGGPISSQLTLCLSDPGSPGELVLDYRKERAAECGVLCP